jgi:uncharacterized protein YegJ (DUF2314 family)
MKYTLEDGEKMHEQSPVNFNLPSLDSRNNLKVGEIVKLVFNIEHSQGYDEERMWVIVEKIDGLKYIGCLDNDPHCTGELKAGELVEFSAKHVIAIHSEFYSTPST